MFHLGGGCFLRHKNSSILIGNRTTFVQVNMFALEGKKIHIGEDCMFSSGIYIRNSDEHTIYRLDTGERINFAEDIVIGNHVWIGEGVSINKGVVLPDNVIIGCRSLVTKQSKVISDCVYAGVPIKLIRSGVSWCRKLRTELPCLKTTS